MRAWVRSNASGLAWGAWTLAVVLAVASLLFLVLSWSTPAPAGTFGFRGFAAMFALTFGTVGATVAARLPGNPIGWLMLGSGVLSGFQELANQYAIWAVLEHEPPLAFGQAAAWIPAWIWIPGTAGAMLALFLFPDGQLLAPWWRWAAGVGLLGTVMGSVGFALVPGPLENFRAIDNPFAVGTGEAFGVVALVGLVLYGVGFIMAGVSVALRFRWSAGGERQQLRWLVTAGAFLAVSLVASFVDQVVNVDRGADVGFVTSLIVIAGFSSFPVAMGIAILRYRLYDLDLVIRKTIVFGILVALLTAIFLVTAVAVGGTIARTEAEGSALPAIVLAFAIGALTVPLWRLSRRIADMVVFGGRATPYQVLSEFVDRVGATYSADDVLPRMAQVLGSALGAEEATVWLRVGRRYLLEAAWPSPSSAGRQPPEGAFEVRHQGELLGALAVRQPANDPMDPSKARLARDLATQAGPVLRNVMLLEDLRESRRRIVAAQDERAKKLERDIHDGAQQQLVALAVKQRLAQALVGKDDDRARQMLQELQEETKDALENLRDLARGIYPPLLADKGLTPALEAQARKSPVPVRVESDGIGRYAQEIESAVYFAVLEALQNTAKYAEATRAIVRLVQGDVELTFTVTDDGKGFDDAGLARGSGLQGMADRLEAVGGRCEVRSQPGEGTTVTGRVPTPS